MLTYQKQFIQFAIASDVLKFGTFTLKSGRISPYFFNAGGFSTSAALARLGYFYAETLIASQLEYDLLFGPAYKGIPLVSSLAVALSHYHQLDVPYAFNRKEAKSHGEGGQIVGAPLQGKVLIIDDVITAGTAIREVIHIITQAGAVPAGVVIALDRQERGQRQNSAIQEIQQHYQIPVLAIVTLEQILEYIGDTPEFNHYYADVASYRQRYGVTSPSS